MIFVIAQLRRGYLFIKEAAIIALAEIAAKGDEHTMAVVTAHLEDADRSVRNAARKALSRIV